MDLRTRVGSILGRLRRRDASLLSERLVEYLEILVLTACTVRVVLQDKRLARESMRTVEITRQRAMCAQLGVLDRAPTRDPSAAGTQAWRAAQTRGWGGRFFGDSEALRVIRIPHFAEPRPKKRHFGSSGSPPGARSQPHCSRQAP